MKKNVPFALFALLFVPLLSHAQGLGSITGRVMDPGGASVAGAQVTATQEGTGFSRSAVTDTDGLYVIPSLQPATYRLTVEAKGFSTSKESGITLLADQTLTVNVGVRLGMTTEVIVVSGNALQVDTSTSTLKQVIEQQRLVEMPLEGRNAAKLSLLVPGTVFSVSGGADQARQRHFPAPSRFPPTARGRTWSVTSSTAATTSTSTPTSTSPFLSRMPFRSSASRPVITVRNMGKTPER